MLADPLHLPPDLPLHDAAAAGKAHYILDDATRLALRMAWATRRPLLVVGEAGCGKTQLAQALACEWKVPLLKQVVNAQTKGDDLLYSFDAVARLADAQVYAALRDHHAGKSGDVLDPGNYLWPGRLWWAWNWQDAASLIAARPPHRAAKVPHHPDGWQPDQGSVVLIDEIDKAQVEVPEGLLEVLDGGSFDIPWTGKRVHPPVGTSTARPPLVIITSNGARELPGPFLRRCIVLAMAVPVTGLQPWLQQRARAHFSSQQCPDAVTRRAADIIALDRTLAVDEGRYIPGVAEYLDLLTAVVELSAGQADVDPLALLDDLAPSVTTHKGKAVVA